MGIVTRILIEPTWNFLTKFKKTMAKYLTPNEVANKIEDMLERLETMEGVHQALGERLDTVLTKTEQILNMVTTPEATPDDETI